MDGAGNSRYYCRDIVGSRKKSNWKIGDKVCALLGGGGYAQYVNVKYNMLMPIPDGCSVIEAAAIPEAFATAMEKPECFELMVRIPDWSKKTSLLVNGEYIEVRKGYTVIEREWHDGDCIELQLDMQVRLIYPQPYGSQIMMSRMISALDYVIPVYDEEDVLAKKHVALMRGPIVLAQENRLGYSVDDPIRLLINSDDGVDAVFAEKKIAPYKNMLELEIPLANGTTMHVTDYASAGKTWSEESKMAAWMLTE